jgi:hypothetical protein
MSHPLHAADGQHKQGKARDTKAELKDVKHRALLVSDAAILGGDRRKGAMRVPAKARKDRVNTRCMTFKDPSGSVVPAAGLEPARPYGQGILSLRINVLWGYAGPFHGLLS